ncbi:hypothetical protein B9G55_14865 [Saccharibacillus sp. O16]|nr:hypothetical protein B9G55_14865 [Saccharibacillus sp. O16]
MLIIILAAAAALWIFGIAAAALGSRIQHPAAIAANLLLMGIVFGLGRAMNVEPGRSSGNGNPAMLLLVPLVGLGVVLVGQLYGQPLLRRARPLLLLTLLLGLFAHQAAGFELQKLRYEARGMQVAAFFAARREPGRMDQDAVTPTLDSMKINGHLFHPNTYLLFVGWVWITAIALLLLRWTVQRRRLRQEGDDEGVDR